MAGGNSSHYKRTFPRRNHPLAETLDKGMQSIATNPHPDHGYDGTSVCLSQRAIDLASKGMPPHVSRELMDKLWTCQLPSARCGRRSFERGPASYSVLKLNTCKVDEKKLPRIMVEAFEHCATVMQIQRQAFNLRYSRSNWWPSHRRQPCYAEAILKP